MTAVAAVRECKRSSGIQTLDEIAAQATFLGQASRAEATRRAYRSDWSHFEAWCRGHALGELPAAPMTVGLYVAAHRDQLSVATLTRRLSSIATAHRMAGHALDTKHPAIRDVMQGLRRTKGVAARHAEALTTPLLRKLLATCATDRLLDRRDRALLLVGFAGAFRRSELVALGVEDVAVSEEGMKITVRRSKGDQEGEGETVAVMRTNSGTCPVAAYEAWVAAAITTGRVFRAVDRHGRIASKLSTNAVAEILQRRAALAGLDPRVFSGHSMRAGFATSAAAVGVEERVIMKQTRHRSVAIVRRYIRDGELFRRNLAAEVGL